jgi:hypothetical protein
MVAIMLGAGQVRADTAIAADLDYGAPLEDGSEWGAGFSIRLGQQVHLPALVLTPELVFNHQAFSGVGPTREYRGLIGLRLGVGEILRPGVYTHIGFGRLDFDSPVSPGDGLTYDAGAFLDFTLLPLVNIGAHVGYNALSPGNDAPTFEWVNVGVHGALVF